MRPVQINTSTAAADTIDYVATDQTGLTATSTRTVHHRTRSIPFHHPQRHNSEHAILNRELIYRPLLIFTSGTPCDHVRTSSVLSVGCPKAATYRSPRFLHLAALVPSAGTILI
jgi:hypothetical protein